jgi:tyrosyl-tRNA synthetase
MQILDELEARGLIQEVSDRDALAQALAAGPITFYCGYDPTAVSLHAGNLVPLSVATRLSRAGNRFIALVGGATGMVGDPSGKSSERKLLDAETLATNVEAVRSQVQRFVAADAMMVNNVDWFAGIGFLEFLRDAGKHITVNYMLAKESVRARLEDREQGISYTEFSYMLLQGYDFTHLAREHGCRLQIGGADQWGNITCGIELHRKMGGAQPIFGLVSPLLLTAAGTKFGKSEKGQNVWLDPRMTSPYQFYQYWLNADDADVEKYLKMFTFVPLDEIGEIMAAHDPDRAKRLAQRRLADEVTTWVHGAEATRRAIAASQVLFGGAVADLTDADLEAIIADAPATDVPWAELEAGIALLDLLVRTGICDSKSEARRLVGQGGAYVNNVRVDDPNRAVTGAADLATESMILLRGGKKKYRIVRAVRGDG